MRVNANAVLRSWTLLAAFGGSYAPAYIHILVYMYVSTLTGLIVQMVLTELMHNHVCETVNVLTGLMHTMYICDNM